MQPNHYKIYSNTQFEIQDLRLAVGNFGTMEVVGNDGKKSSAQSLGAQLYFRDNPSLNTKMTIVMAQSLSIGKYKITLKEIERDNRGRYAIFEILIS